MPLSRNSGAKVRFISGLGKRGYKKTSFITRKMTGVKDVLSTECRTLCGVSQQ